MKGAASSKVIDGFFYHFVVANLVVRNIRKEENVKNFSEGTINKSSLDLLFHFHHHSNEMGVVKNKKYEGM